MFDRDLGKGAFAGSVFRRHGRMILMSVAAVVIVGGLVQGAFVPKPLDFGVVTALIVRRFFIVSALIVRRFGLMRTSVTALVLLMTAIAVMPSPHCGGREKAYFAAMKSDLKNLASQEEIYYSDHDAYTSSATDLAFTNSEGVEITVHATPKGWAAWATHAALGSSEGCAIYYGESPVSWEMIVEVTPIHPGVIVCTR